MAYTKTTWVDGETIASAEKLNNIENGIGALDTAVSGLLDFFYPVGTIYETTSTDLDTTTKMATHFGGTWEAWGSGRVPVGVDTTQTEFDTVEETGGAKTHTLTIDEMPSHNHKQKAHNWDVQTASGTSISANEGDYLEDTSSTGGGLAHNNLQPYITCYMWKRTA